jgi:hypothetical protein
MQALRWPARAYVFGTAVAAASTLSAALWVATDNLPVLAPVWVMAPIYIVASGLPTRLATGVTLTANVPVLIAAYLIGGWAVAAVVAGSGLVWVRRERLEQQIFNTSMWLLAGAAGGLVYTASGGVTALDWQVSGLTPSLLLPVVLSIVAVIVVNASLMLGVLKVAENIGPLSVWRSMIVTSVVPYFAYGLFGLLMAVLWSIGGGFAAALVLIPLLVARWAYAQYAEQRQAYEATIRSLVQAVETKDHYTRGHSERVSRASVMIARILRMREDRVEALRYAGILHDVGKLGVPTRVLQKTGPLSDLEYAAIQLHPVRGTEMVRGIAFLEEAYAGILHHHERLDGRGYPSGLKGDEIPEFARVIAVADAFDSMTSTRSYRGARRVSEALAELRKCEGTQFDSEMVHALVAALDREPWRTVGPVDQSAADVELAGGPYDHDDPTVSRPEGHDEGAAVEAARAEVAEEHLLHDKDVLRRGGWS